jgi:hypothetical protein
MTRYGVPHSWLYSLGHSGGGSDWTVIGIGVPLIGVSASVGLVVYFVGAIITVVRAQLYSHLRYPTPFLLFAMAALVLRLTAS